MNKLWDMFTQKKSIDEQPKISQYLNFVREKVNHELIKKPLGIDVKNNGADIELMKHGIVILPNFFSKEEVEIFRNSISNTEYAPSPEMQHSFANPLADKFIENAGNIRGLEGFFKNSNIARIVQSYFSSSATPGRTFVRIKEDTGPTASFENFYHFDSFKDRVKVFLYLTDVGIKNAPVAYIKGTHRTGLWRIKKEFEMFSGYKKDLAGYAKDDESAYIGCYWPHEIVQLLRTYDFSEETCVGQAGTVIIFDAKGLHKATQLVEGKRSILMSHWFIPNHHT